MAPRQSATGHIFSLIRRSRKIDLYDYKSTQEFLLLDSTTFGPSVLKIIMAYLYCQDPPNNFGMPICEIKPGQHVDVRLESGWWTKGEIKERKGDSVLIFTQVGRSKMTENWIMLSERYRFAPLGKFTQNHTPSIVEKKNLAKVTVSGKKGTSSCPYKIHDDVKIWRFSPPPRRKWVPGTVTNIAKEQIEVTYFYKKIKPYSCWFHLRSGEIISNFS